MNEARRKEISAACALLSEARQKLEAVRDEEQEAFDSMPENFQNGEKGENAQMAIDGLDEVILNLENAENDLDGITTG